MSRRIESSLFLAELSQVNGGKGVEITRASQVNGGKGVEITRASLIVSKISQVPQNHLSSSTESLVKALA